jgi:uncharacterized protein YggU (UPF0235/DUF167 family)
MRLVAVVHPSAGRQELRWDGRELRLWITQPPANGAANVAALRLVATWLGVAPSRVRLIAGRSSRHKLLEVEGVQALPAPDEARLA